MIPSLKLNGTATLRAARGGKAARKIQILAYSGRVLRGAAGPISGPFVVDLAGLSSPESVPLTLDHTNEVQAIAGGGEPNNDGRRLTISGTLATDTEAGSLVLSLLEAGAPVSASVEVDIRATRFLQSGEVAQLNGEEIEAASEGVTVITTANLRAVSLVAIGADQESAARLAASVRNKNMSDKGKATATTVAPDEATMRANRIRRDGIQAAMAKYGAGFPDAAEFIEASGQTALSDESWTPADFENLLARETTRCQRLDASPAPSWGRGRAGAHGVPTKDTIAAAILLKCGRADVAEKSYGQGVVQAAKNLRCDSLLDIARAGLRLNGHVDATGGRDAVIKAAFSTGSLPIGLGDSANKLALSQYQQAPGSWRTFCKIVNLTDFKDHHNIRPHFAGASMAKLAPSGELNHASYQEETFTINADTFGEILTISRKELINDDLGLFAQFAESLARKAASTVSDIIYTLILSNPNAHFHADNSNLRTGAGSALSISSLSDAITLLRKQSDVSGKPIDLIPRILLVPPELEADARQIVRSATLERNTSSADNLPTASPIPQDLQLAIEPRLSSTAFANYSLTAWYLLSGPGDAPMLAGFLNGKDGPTVETANADSSVLGIVIRGWIDAGVAMGDFRAAVKSDGA